jgi:hypothetical protein
MGTATKMLQNVKELMGELAEEKPMVLAAIIGKPARAVWICCASTPPCQSASGLLGVSRARHREKGGGGGRQPGTQGEGETFMGMAQVS